MLISIRTGRDAGGRPWVLTSSARSQGGRDSRLINKRGRVGVSVLISDRIFLGCLLFT